ncbi:MAG: hypothetical protein OXH96_25100 [Spirochaetaceae bacterium]|nr:hypothetical protein [Spirochaetaceae bacterium]
MTWPARGDERPNNPIAHGVHIRRLATGETDAQYVDTAKQAAGQRGGEARVEAVTSEQRQQIAKQAAAARWEQ